MSTYGEDIIRFDTKAPKSVLRYRPIAQRDAVVQTPTIIKQAMPATRVKKKAKGNSLLFLIFGMFIIVFLIIVGSAVLRGVQAVDHQWHTGDIGATSTDANVGHGGISHFVAFDRDNTIIVLEFSADYQKGHLYRLAVTNDTAQHAVYLDTVQDGSITHILVKLDSEDSAGLELDTSSVVLK